MIRIPVPGNGAEDVVVDDSYVYTGTDDGAVLRLTHDGRRIERIADTRGRPLGLELTPDGRLVVCDAHRGLLLVDPGTGDVEVLCDAVDGVPMRFCNNAAVGRDGDIWFSDSSRHFGIGQWRDDLVQHTRTGRLLHWVDGEVEVVLDGLAFANGVALSADESFVAVAETGARTVVRHRIGGEVPSGPGTRDVLAGGLPGYPDNIARGSDGLIWVTIASPTDPVVTRLQSAPMVLRRLATRIPEPLQPKPARTVRVQAYDDAGRLVHDIDEPATDFHMATGVREHHGRLWLGSLHEPAVAVLDLGTPG